MSKRLRTALIVALIVGLAEALVGNAVQAVIGDLQPEKSCAAPHTD